MAVLEASLRETENALQLSLADLAAKMGLNPITPIAVAERSAPFERFPSIDELAELSVKTRPEITLQEAKIKSARASLEFVRSQRLPEVDFITSFNLGGGYESSVNNSWLLPQ